MKGLLAICAGCLAGVLLVGSGTAAVSTRGGGTAKRAAAIVVDSTADTPGDCSVAGQCTLRAAITAANAGGGTVVVPAGTFTLTAGELGVTGTLEIDGAGAAATVIDGGGAGRVFHADAGSNLTIRNVRITNGSSTGGSAIFDEGGPLTLDSVKLDHNDAPGGSGGAILADGTTTLRNVDLENNAAGQAGAIFSQGDVLTIISSTISSNSADGPQARGGGIASFSGTFRLLDSVVANNTVTNTHPSLIGAGGGVYAIGSHVVVDSSTISGNSASGGAGTVGGGLDVGTRATITNSTISGNSADGSGGIAESGRLSIVDSTISDNTSSPSQPGGIWVNGPVEIVSSTLADNVPENITNNFSRVRVFGDVLSESGGHPDCGSISSGAYDSDGYSVVSDASCNLLAPTDVQSQDPLLGALQDNGGGTLTRLPGLGSPARSIFPAGVAMPPTDQRGAFRPASGADAGAIERVAGTVGVTISAPATVLSGETFDVVLTLRNRSGAPISGASLALGATTRTIGTLADGASDVELFSVSASSPSTCAGAPLALAVAATWNGSTQTATDPVHVTPNCGGVTGQVTTSGIKVVGAVVDVCQTTLATCTEVTTNSSGSYIAYVPDGTYTVKAFPTASSPASAAVTTVGPATVTAPNLTTQDVSLTLVTPPPPNVNVNKPTGQNGLPQVPRGAGATVTLSDPCSGSAPTGWSIAGGGTVIASGPFVPVPSAPPNTYQATIPMNLPLNGVAFFATACGSAPVPAWPFRYYDPSGVVKDANGNPVSGATVTLFRADSASGPFTAVPNGSDDMSPDNRRNPDQTLADGTYAWDVVGGFYKVHAEKNGCTADSAVLTVPPAATGVDLVLSCPAPTPPAPPAQVATAPGAPTSVTAVLSGASVTVSWAAPASDGGAAITSYEVTRVANGVPESTTTTSGLTFAATGLRKGVSYTFTIAARNAAGLSAGSAPSNAVVVRTAPDPPTGVTATPGNGTATVRWRAPASDGGSAITGYVVTRFAAGAAQGTTTVGNVTEATITGLANGTAYTFAVAAVNAVGTSVPSAASAAATPAAPRFTLIVTKAGRGDGTVAGGGLDCGASCTASLEEGTAVTLTATAAPGSTFAGWGGACSGTGTCTVTLTAATSVTATFDRQVFTPPSCLVPNVVGKPLAAAEHKLAAGHCAAGAVKRAKSRTVRKGVVISQSPRAGKKLAAGSKIDLVVSAGK